MEVNGEEQNIEEDTDATEVDVGLRLDLNYEPGIDRRSEFVTLHLPKIIMHYRKSLLQKTG